MILPKIRDPRFITERRGGSLTDDDHRLLAIWAADCAQHVLHYFEEARPDDDVRRAIDLGRAWARDEVTWDAARTAGFAANAAARALTGPARKRRTPPARPQRSAIAAAHELGAAACAIRAAQAASASSEREQARHRECEWQRQLSSRSATSSSTTSGCATSCAGSCSILIGVRGRDFDYPLLRVEIAPEAQPGSAGRAAAGGVSSAGPGSERRPRLPASRLTSTNPAVDGRRRLGVPVRSSAARSVGAGRWATPPSSRGSPRR